MKLLVIKLLYYRFKVYERLMNTCLYMSLEFPIHLIFPERCQLVMPKKGKQGKCLFWQSAVELWLCAHSFSKIFSQI